MKLIMMIKVLRAKVDLFRFWRRINIIYKVSYLVSYYIHLHDMYQGIRNNESYMQYRLVNEWHNCTTTSQDYPFSSPRNRLSDVFRSDLGLHDIALSCV